MERVGRNDPCPCGSNRKYKKCHGSPTKSEDLPKSRGVLPPVEVPFGGLFGQRQEYTVINVPFGNDPRGGPGKYKVVFTLVKPGIPLTTPNSVDFSPELTGDSHIALPTEAAIEKNASANADQGKAPHVANSPASSFAELLIDGVTPEGSFKFHGYPNKFGRLGRIECQVDASSFADAKQKTFRAIASSLSSWSAQLDIPIEIGRTHITELTTTTTQVDWTVPYPDVPLAIRSEGELEQEFRGYASLYREAMNSNSPVHQFLCFFKLIEGIRARRKRIDRAAKAQEQPVPVRSPEATPADKVDFAPWLNRIFHIRRKWDEMALDSIFLADIRGKDFDWIYDQKLNPLRVDVAHGFLEKGELRLSADELLHTHRVEELLPITKCITRRMLKNEFPNQFLAFLGEDGVINP